MTAQLARARAVCLIGWLVMVVSAALTLTSPSILPDFWPVLSILGAITALVAHGRSHQLRRIARKRDHYIGLGGYQFDLLHQPRFARQRRRLA